MSERERPADVRALLEAFEQRLQTQLYALHDDMRQLREAIMRLVQFNQDDGR